MSNDTPNPNATPAGWFPDHGNPQLERYWDGTMWTEQRRPAQGPAAGYGAVQAKQKRPFFTRKAVWIPAAIIGLFVVIGLATSGEDPASEGTDPAAADAPAKSDEKKAEPAKEPAKKPAKPVKVDAGTLLKTFEKNELKGDQLYKGKTLQVTGVVSQVETDIFNSDKYILMVNGGGDYEFLSVNCHGLSQKALSNIEPGQDIVMTGKFDDGGSLGVELKGCTL